MGQNRTKLTLVNLAGSCRAGIGTLHSCPGFQCAALPMLSFRSLLWGAFITAVSYFHMRLVERERIEQLEDDELTKSPSASALFDKSDTESLPAQRPGGNLKSFYPGVYDFAVACGSGGRVSVLALAREAARPGTARAPVGGGRAGDSVARFFLLGRFSVALARPESQRLLGSVASYILADSVSVLRRQPRLASFILSSRLRIYWPARSSSSWTRRDGIPADIAARNISAARTRKGSPVALR